MKSNQPITVASRVPSHDEIQRLAYQIWQRKGSPIGASLECWLEAERTLSGRLPRRTFGASRKRAGRGEANLEAQLDELLSRTAISNQPRSPTSL